MFKHAIPTETVAYNTLNYVCIHEHIYNKSPPDPATATSPNKD